MLSLNKNIVEVKTSNVKINFKIYKSKLIKNNIKTIEIKRIQIEYK